MELEYAQCVNSFGSFFVDGQFGYGPLLFDRMGFELGVRAGARFTLLGDVPEGLYVDAGIAALFWSWRERSFLADSEPVSFAQGFGLGTGMEVGIAGVFFKHWLLGAALRVEYLFSIGGHYRYSGRFSALPTLRTGVVF